MYIVQCTVYTLHCDSYTVNCTALTLFPCLLLCMVCCVPKEHMYTGSRGVEYVPVYHSRDRSVISGIQPKLAAPLGPDNNRASF